MTAALEGGEWSASHPGRTLTRERPGTHFTGGWVGSRASLDSRKISSPPEFDPRPSSPKLVTIPNELPSPHFNGSTKLKQYYKLYCEILSEVIIKAKNLSCNEQIMKPQNKAKTTWNITKQRQNIKERMWSKLIKVFSILMLEIIIF